MRTCFISQPIDGCLVIARLDFLQFTSFTLSGGSARSNPPRRPVMVRSWTRGNSFLPSAPPWLMPTEAVAHALAVKLSPIHDFENPLALLDSLWQCEQSVAEEGQR